MLRRDLDYILRLLDRIKPQDEHVLKAKAIIEKDLAVYNSRRGQLKDMYESDYKGY